MIVAVHAAQALAAQAVAAQALAAQALAAQAVAVQAIAQAVAAQAIAQAQVTAIANQKEKKRQRGPQERRDAGEKSTFQKVPQNTRVQVRCKFWLNLSNLFHCKGCTAKVAPKVYT